MVMMAVWLGSSLMAAPPEVEPAKAPPADSPKPIAIDESFMTYFYEHPAPDRVPELYRWFFTQIAGQESRLGPTMIAFFSELIKKNPDSAGTWTEALASQPSASLRWWYEILATSQTEQARTVLQKVANADGAIRNRDAKRLLASTYSELTSLPVSSALVMDMLWSAFFATGDERFVLRLITLLDKEHSPGMLYQAAKWSLSSNAFQHDKVLKICREQSKSHEKERIRAELCDVVFKAELQLQKEPSPDPALKTDKK